MKEVIARTKLIGLTVEGEKHDIEVKIGVPYKVEHDDGLEEWACPVSLTPLYNRLHDAHGSDSFQAMCLAASLVIDLLTSFQEKGGELMLEGGDAFPLDAYWFGHAKNT